MVSSLWFVTYVLIISPIFDDMQALLIHFEVGICQKEVFSNSNFGEYFFEWKYVGPCETGKGTDEIQWNCKLTKKNRRTQVFGNFTFLIPWDETVSIHLHYMKLGSNAGWIKNAYLWNIAGCTQYRLLLPNAFQRHMDLPHRCPFPKGVYMMREFDVDELLKDAGPLVPKTFFYGSYKVICDIKKNDKTVGCAAVAIDFVPKWQKRNRTRH